MRHNRLNWCVVHMMSVRSPAGRSVSCARSRTRCPLLRLLATWCSPGSRLYGFHTSSFSPQMSSSGYKDGLCVLATRGRLWIVSVKIYRRRHTSVIPTLTVPPVYMHLRAPWEFPWIYGWDTSGSASLRGTTFLITLSQRSCALVKHR